ncbi:MAG: aldehyde dehydrogenase family protein [Methylobacteriaceae bacterium]|nr:aldehyde dehydrogenase family protein [Methylobacteriaceae bacterium]
MSDIVCVSPIDGRIVARRVSASPTHIASSLERARDAQRDWARVPLAGRAELCAAFVDAMLAMESEIAPELALQMGRPVRYGGGELRGLAERARYMIDIADEALADIDPGPKDGFRRFIRRAPLGLVFTIAPWNYPYLTAVNSIVPALMAGNAVILKHAAQTILVGERFQKAFDAAGLPEGLFQTLVLTHDDTLAIIAGGEVDHVCFTGSVEAGRAIERAAAGTFTGVGLELGGKDPAYVRADCHFDHAVENVVDGAFFNSGQSCCGIERVYVAAPIHDRFVEAATALARQYVLDDPLKPATTLGPMARASLAETVRGQTRAALAAGARATMDEKAFAASRAGTPWLAPQILVNVDHSMQVMTEESFGPVLGIMKVDSDDEAIALMNDSRYGLTASIWTADGEAAERIGDRLKTGTVFLNRADYLDPALAWTGVKDTGRGATLSRVGYEQLTRPKSFHLRLKV